uniref:von Willebrand factor A domain-containing protein 1 n=1 Tax=Anas zonorhyncha TaxID=75864 RepID=A0A8B9V0I5_9AVES
MGLLLALPWLLCLISCAQPSISNAEGDILFLLDSSGSVSYYEFSKVKEFMWDLVRPFSFGPKDVQTSIIHISTTPTMEFPFDRYQSRGGVQQAIRDTRQLMGDTNTGQALSYAKEKFFSNEAGARPEVPKVLVWVTDGFSTDDISEPMQLLKDMGVTVFIVSTGRGNYLELSAAASQPPEKHLHFVDVDDLPIITKELRDAMLGTTGPGCAPWESECFCSVTPLSERVLPLPAAQPSAETPSPARWAQQGSSSPLPARPWLRREQDQLRTHSCPFALLSEEITPAQLLISESSPHSFQVSWAPTPDSVAAYQVLYGPLPGDSAQLLEVDGKRNSTVVENLAPNTTYLVTVTAIYRSGKEKSLSAKACTDEKPRLAGRPFS